MAHLRNLFLRHIAQTTASPLMLDIERAEGMYLYDRSGKSYMDLISGISVSSLGHGNQKVIKAIKEQAESYLHIMVYGELIQSPQVQLAQKIASLVPMGDDTSVYFTNSGSEAIEGAMKLAKRYTGRSHFVSLTNAYHGSTHGPLSLTADPYYSDFYRPLLPNITRISLNNTEQISAITSQTAAVFIEPIMGEAGYLVSDPNWLKEVRERCNQTGSLLVFDEIQCGMGRTGSVFAFENLGVIPDVLVLSKAMGAGMPLGCFIATKKIMYALASNPILGHISTFGGHPVCCAASLAGLEYLLDNKLYESVNKKEKKWRSCLKHPKFGNISGKGLMLGLTLPSKEFCFELVSRCIDKGLLTDWFLYAPNKLRIAPPLIITEEQIEHACNIICEAASSIQIN